MRGKPTIGRYVVIMAGINGVGIVGVVVTIVANAVFDII